MARITSYELKARRQNFMREAGRAFDQMLGTDGQNSLVTFAEREGRPCELGDASTCRLLEEYLGANDAADPGAEVPCAICGRPVSCDEPEKVEMQGRKVQTRRGEVNFERAARRCTPCRRIFFPRG